MVWICKRSFQTNIFMCIGIEIIFTFCVINKVLAFEITKKDCRKFTAITFIRKLKLELVQLKCQKRIDKDSRHSMAMAMMMMMMVV